MNYLFICSANQQRSKTAEDFFSEAHPQHEFLSAGTNLKTCRQLGTQEVTADLLDWADVIYVMEHKHQRAIGTLFGKDFHARISVLNIPDRYKYMQNELIGLLKEKVEL